jgi:hypothetical protein
MPDKSGPKASSENKRPVPQRSWRHARYGDAPDPPRPGPHDQTFSEQADAERTGDARKN